MDAFTRTARGASCWRTGSRQGPSVAMNCIACGCGGVGIVLSACFYVMFLHATPSGTCSIALHCIGGYTRVVPVTRGGQITKENVTMKIKYISTPPPPPPAAPPPPGFQEYPPPFRRFLT